MKVLFYSFRHFFLSPFSTDRAISPLMVLVKSLFGLLAYLANHIHPHTSLDLTLPAAIVLSCVQLPLSNRIVGLRKQLRSSRNFQQGVERSRTGAAQTLIARSITSSANYCC